MGDVLAHEKGWPSGIVQTTHRKLAGHGDSFFIVVGEGEERLMFKKLCVWRIIH